MLSCIGESSPAGQADTAALPFVLERGAVRLKEFVLTALVSLVYCIPRVQRQAIHSRVHAWFWIWLEHTPTSSPYWVMLAVHTRACNDNCILIILGWCKGPWPVNFDSFGLNFKYPSGNAITQQLTTSIYFLLESVTNWSRFGQWICKFRVGPLSMQFKDVQCPLERRGMPYFCFFYMHCKTMQDSSLW